MQGTDLWHGFAFRAETFCALAERCTLLPNLLVVTLQPPKVKFMHRINLSCVLSDGTVSTSHALLRIKHVA